MHRTKPRAERTAEEIEAELRAKAYGPRKPRLAKDTIEITANSGTPTIELLNRVAIFQGRIQFASLRRTGSIIQADFAGNRKAYWRTATDLRTFSRSQDILLDATGFLIRTPLGRTGIKRIWEPIAQMIRAIADQNATDTEPPLEDEFKQIIRATWERADRPEAHDRDAFNQVLKECLLHKRDHNAEPPRCCVWVGEAYCWIHQPSLTDWLSTPVAKSKHYPFDDVRAALQLLGFTQRDLNRSVDGKGVHCRVWRGSLDVLIDDETEPPEA